MSSYKKVSAAIAISADQATVFEKMTDWEMQSKWVFGTKVWAVGDDTNMVGGRLAAFTGFWKIGLLDTMTITKWDPPKLCEVTHTGKLVKGSGLFEVKIVDGKTYFIWTEHTYMPFGMIGTIAWVIIRPVALLGLKVSLNQFERLIAKE